MGAYPRRSRTITVAFALVAIGGTALHAGPAAAEGLDTAQAIHVVTLPRIGDSCPSGQQLTDGGACAKTVTTDRGARPKQRDVDLPYRTVTMVGAVSAIMPPLSSEKKSGGEIAQTTREGASIVAGDPVVGGRDSKSR